MFIDDSSIASRLDRGVFNHVSRQILTEQEPLIIMRQVTKEDCITVDEAAKELNFSRASVYNYMNMLDIQRYRFRVDRHTYIRKIDVERIREFKAENKG